MTEEIIPQDQILGQLKTRGFDPGFGTPLRHFRGRLTGLTGSMVQRGQMKQARLEVMYHFDELEVIESTEPYPFPILKLPIMQSTKPKSSMGVLGASMDRILNADADGNLSQAEVRNQDALIGLLQEWKMTPGHMMWDGNAGKETPREAWEVVWVEGIGGTQSTGVDAPSVAGATGAGSPAQSASAKAIELLDGKTQQQWNSIVFQDPLVKKDTNLTANIIGGQFLQPLLDAGIVTIDEAGIYHVSK